MRFSPYLVFKMKEAVWPGMCMICRSGENSLPDNQPGNMDLLYNHKALNLFSIPNRLEVVLSSQLSNENSTFGPHFDVSLK